MPKEKTLLVVGASAGGSTALPDLIKQIDQDLPLSVLVVMHLAKKSIGELLVNRLQKLTSLKCKIPLHGDTIREKHVYIAMPDHHLMVKGDKILLGQGPMENRYRPSIDALFRSAAVEYGPRAIGIILTGMLEDGASGMYAIRKCGGICIIQDLQEAKYPDMPQAVLNVLKPDYAVPLPKMGEAIGEAVLALRKKKKVAIPPDLQKEAQIAERVNVGIENVEGLGEISQISCPGCGGSLWAINDNGFSRYRCHVGHAFSEDGLISSMQVSTESTLWVALRMLDERKNLLRQIAEKESAKGKRALASSYSSGRRSWQPTRRN